MEHSGKFKFNESNEVRQEVIDKIWDIAKISPDHGNMLMDIIGTGNYYLVMSNHSGGIMKKLKEKENK